jgi:hypothetical protein
LSKKELRLRRPTTANQTPSDCLPTAPSYWPNNDRRDSWLSQQPGECNLGYRGVLSSAMRWLPPRSRSPDFVDGWKPKPLRRAPAGLGSSRRSCQRGIRRKV